MQKMLTLDEVNKLIEQGKNLIISADEIQLKKLKNGNWIGGTIPYFMSEKGGLFTQEMLQVLELPNDILEVKIEMYDEENLKKIYNNAYDNGFIFAIIPGFSKIHKYFAEQATNFDNFATKPLVGWISGISLNEIGKNTPKVFAKDGNSFSDNKAAVAFVKLPENVFANINIINIFKQGDGDEIEFVNDGFEASEAIVNGNKVNFAEYVKNNNLDVKLPLVADYFGSMINVSFESVKDDKVTFYAPVFRGVKYKQAAPVANYVQQFENELKNIEGQTIFFSCNCILNYLYSELEGKKTGNVTGPMTFGEIAYQLLNQTLVYLTLENK